MRGFSQVLLFSPHPIEVNRTCSHLIHLSNSNLLELNSVSDLFDVVTPVGGDTTVSFVCYESNFLERDSLVL